MIPNFRYFSDGTPRLDHTNHAKVIERVNASLLNIPNCRTLPRATPEGIYSRAICEVLDLSRDVTNTADVLGSYQLQFGLFKGKSFSWVVENALDWAASVAARAKREGPDSSPISKNKFALLEYLEMFPVSAHVVDVKLREQEIVSLTMRKGQETNTRDFPASTSSAAAADLPSDKDSLPCTAVGSFEKPEHASIDDLPSGWRSTLKLCDQKWIAKAIFVRKRNQRPCLNWRVVDKLWWHPPQPPYPIGSRPPCADQYFATPLLLWLPRRILGVELVCPQADCRNPLTSAGLYPRVRRVLDVEFYYNLAAEYLQCSACKKKEVSWSQSILDQLDVARRSLFRVVLANRYACDARVVSLMREMAYAPARLQKILTKFHSETWMHATMHYLSHCALYKEAMAHDAAQAPTFRDPPCIGNLPSLKWLQVVHRKDVLQRLDDLEGTIRSTYGKNLKIASNSKATIQLAGLSSSTSLWVTNVGSETGQVLTSVLTADDGRTLRPMALGLVQRYEQAGVPPPKVLYTDRDCCGSNSIAEHLFPEWPNLTVRLDTCNFLRRIAACCTSEVHVLYEVFRDGLSRCIFEWDQEDLSRLKEAKKSELVAKDFTNPSDDAVLEAISSKEISLHCRLRTRGADEICKLIEETLDFFLSVESTDSQSVPLLDAQKISLTWDDQKRHLSCLQDVEGVQLYTETGSVTKNGFVLPEYRCARGLASLSLFDTYLNRLIPVTSISSVNFQAKLVESIARWNEDKATRCKISSCNHVLRFAINSLSRDVLDKPMFPDCQTVSKCTGELLGVDYLYDQTGEYMSYVPADVDDELLSMTDSEYIAECDGDSHPAVMRVIPKQPSSAKDPLNTVLPVNRRDCDVVAELDEHLASSCDENEGAASATTANVKAPPSDFSLPDSTADPAMTSKVNNVLTSDRCPTVLVLQLQSNSARPIAPRPDVRVVLMPQSIVPTPSGQQSAASSISSPTIPRSTLYYHRRRERQAQKLGMPVRRNALRKGPIVCRKCGKERLDKHQQYYGNWYCARTASVSYDEWLAEFKRQRKAKQKPK